MAGAQIVVGPEEVCEAWEGVGGMSGQIRVEDTNGHVVLARGGGPAYGKSQTTGGVWSDVQLADRRSTCPSFKAPCLLGWSPFQVREGGEASWVKSPDNGTFPAAWRPTGFRGAWWLRVPITP